MRFILLPTFNYRILAENKLNSSPGVEDEVVFGAKNEVFTLKTLDGFSMRVGKATVFESLRLKNIVTVGHIVCVDVKCVCRHMQWRIPSASTSANRFFSVELRRENISNRYF